MIPPSSGPTGDEHSLLPVGSYIAVPEVVLAADGPKRGWAVAVDGGVFVAVDAVETVVANYPDLQRFDLNGVAMIPGFIDCHQHLTQSFGKGMIRGEPAEIWRRVWLPLADATSTEAAYVAAKWTCIEALRGGFTTIVAAGEPDGDKAAEVRRAVSDVGIRCVFGYGHTDLADFESQASDHWSKASTAECLRQAEALATTPSTESKISTSLAVASPASGSLELISAIAEMCAQHGLLFQIHAGEHTPQIQYCLERYGLRPIELLAHIGALGPQTLIAHATLVTSTEIGLLAESGAMVSYNPIASAWKGNAVAPALEFASRGVRFGLGTDNTRNDGFRLIDAAETAQRLTAGLGVDDWRCGGGSMWLRAATAGGAEAAGLGDDVGTIGSGRRADFLLLDMTAPELRPSWDFEWDVVRYYDRTHLIAVYVDGEALLINGRPVGWDLDSFVRENDTVARRTVESADITRVEDRTVPWPPDESE